MSNDIQNQKVVDNDGFYDPSNIKDGIYLFVIQENGTGKRKFEEWLNGKT